MTLLAISFYKTYRAKCYVPLRNKVILWATASVSVGLTLYSIFKQEILEFVLP